MTQAFDPYHSWLGIPLEQQPPDHYRLLGVNTFEQNADVIANAADARMVYLRTFQIGARSGASQKILNEVAAAKACLLDPSRKAAYDQQLRERLATRVPAVAPMTSASPGWTGGNMAHVAPVPLAVHVPKRARTAGQGLAPLAVIGGVVGAVIVVAVVVLALRSRDGETEVAGKPPTGVPAGKPTGGFSRPVPKASATARSPIASSSQSGSRSTRTEAGTGAQPPSAGATTTPAAPQDPASSPVARDARGKDTPPLSRSNVPGMSTGEARKSSPFRVWRPDRVEDDAHAIVETHRGWLEVGRAGVVRYATGVDANDYVELLRPAPPRTVRLWNDRRESSSNNGESFANLGAGRWSQEPYPFRAAARLAGRGKIQLPTLTDVFRPGRPFTFELWYRPIAELPPGNYVLATNGVWRFGIEVEPSARQVRWVARLSPEGVEVGTERQPQLVADWQQASVAYNGRRLMILVDGAGWSFPMTGSAADLVSDQPLIVGGMGPAGEGLWADIAGARLSATCRVVDSDADGAHRPITCGASLPVGKELDPSVVAQWDFVDAKGDVVADRSPNGHAGKLIDAVIVDVTRAAPLIQDTASSSRAKAEKPTAATGATGAKPDAKPAVEPSLADLIGRPPASEPGGAAPLRRPAPDSNALSAALARVKDIYKARYDAAKKSEAKSSLATELGDQAQRTSDDPAAQFVLWDQARQLAADAGQLAAALRYIDELERTFEFDGWPPRVKAAERVSDVLSGAATAPAPLRRQMIDAALAAAARAADADQMEAAGKLAALAMQQSKSRFVGDVPYRQSVKDQHDAITRLLKDWQDFRKAKLHLASEPGDAAAQGVVGRYLCFRRQQWAEGLPHLIQAGLPMIARAAELERAAAQDGKQRLAIADAWEKAAQDASQDDRRACLERAAHWYSEASNGGLAALDQELAQQRLEAIRKVVPQQVADRGTTLSDGTRVDGFPGLIGRVLVGGRDIQVLVKYQADGKIAIDTLNRIVQKAGVQGPVTIELAGQIDLRPTVDTRLFLAGGTPRCEQRVLIDGRSIGAVRTGQPIADLGFDKVAPGRHMIVWQIEGLEPQEIVRFFPFVRGTKEPHPVFHSKQMLETLRASTAKRGEFRVEYDITAPAPKP